MSGHESPKARESQLDKFREAARELETDDDEKRFDQRLGKIAKVKKGEDSAKGKTGA